MARKRSILRLLKNHECQRLNRTKYALYSMDVMVPLLIIPLLITGMMVPIIFMAEEENSKIEEFDTAVYDDTSVIYDTDNSVIYVEEIINDDFAQYQTCMKYSLDTYVNKKSSNDWEIDYNYAVLEDEIETCKSLNTPFDGWATEVHGDSINRYQTCIADASNFYEPVIDNSSWITTFNGGITYWHENYCILYKFY